MERLHLIRKKDSVGMPINTLPDDVDLLVGAVRELAKRSATDIGVLERGQESLKRTVDTHEVAFRGVDMMIKDVKAKEEEAFRNIRLVLETNRKENEAFRQSIMSLEKHVYDHEGESDKDKDKDRDDLKRRVDEMARQLAYVQGRIAAAEKVVSNLPYPTKESSVPEMGCAAEGSGVKWYPVQNPVNEEQKPIAFYKLYKAEESKQSKVYPARHLRKLDRPIGDITHVYFPEGDTTKAPQLISTEACDIIYLYH